MKNIKCSVCGSSYTKKLNYIPTYPNYILMHCNECGLKFVLSDNYEVLGDDSYWNDVNKKIYALPIVLKEFKKKHNKYLKSITKISKPNNKLLDVGCGNGIFLNNAKEYNLAVTGIEPSKIAVELCKKQHDITPINGYLKINSDLPKNYGILSAWDVIEHVENPKKFLEICHKHLQKGGILLLETPDESSIVRKIINIIDNVKSVFGLTTRSNIYYPSHRYYFTHKSIKFLLKNVGFKNVKIFKEHSIFSKSIAKHKFYHKCSKTQLVRYYLIFSILKFPLFWNKQVILCTKK